MFVKGWEQPEAGWWFLAKFVSIVKLAGKATPASRLWLRECCTQIIPNFVILGSKVHV